MSCHRALVAGDYAETAARGVGLLQCFVEHSRPEAAGQPAPAISVFPHPIFLLVLFFVSVIIDLVELPINMNLFNKEECPMTALVRRVTVYRNSTLRVGEEAINILSVHSTYLNLKRKGDTSPVEKAENVRNGSSIG